MNIAQIEENIQEFIINPPQDLEFIYELMLAYGLPKASITRLKKGSLNRSKNKGEVSWKNKVLFREVLDEDLHLKISELEKQTTLNQRFVIVTDYKNILAVDKKINDRLDIERKELPKHFDFFLPWAGMEKSQYQSENPADVKAAVKMAKLFDEIKKDNPEDSPQLIHDLNIFLSRLLFCFFAEDTQIFKENQFTGTIKSHTQKDGSDLDSFFKKLFVTLNKPESERGEIASYLNDFPYVNGGLFSKKIKIPKFTKRSRNAIIESGELDWSQINPDIFGSMIQAVVTPEEREHLGMHYTSVPNIMKVIKPLFLDELYEEFEKAENDVKKLDDLLLRIKNIKIFDPACGSGNFLIIAYKELRRLEMKVIKRRGMFQQLSEITLNQFYGIEIDDFAHEITILSLWLAEHQMNMEFYKEFGRANPTLPLKESGNIVCENACQLDWDLICPKEENDEIYLLGNPPYAGFLYQTEDQKNDIERVFDGIKNVRKLDYISCWFYLGAEFIANTNHQLAFVSTNSIIQGEQVALLWPHILDKLDLEIGYAYTSFSWSNNAKSNAGITCVIIGLRKITNKSKYLFTNGISHNVNNINAYLAPSPNIYVTKRTTPLSEFPRIYLGSSAYDGGNLMIESEERASLIDKYPESEVLFKRFIGSSEFLKGEKRYCLWIEKDKVNLAYSIPPILDRINHVQEFRVRSKRNKTKETAKTPYEFTENRYCSDPSIIIPIVSSQNREYLCVGFLNEGEVIPNSARAIYNPETYLFGVLSSKMHSLWVQTVAGRLREDIRYSAGVCYYSFPLGRLTSQYKEYITQTSLEILETRERFSEKSLGELYLTATMPRELKEAHYLNDLAVERCYRSKPFESDEERLEFLFNLYEKMIAEEKDKGTLFQKKNKKK